MLPDMFDPWMPIRTQGDYKKIVQQLLCLMLVWEGQEVIAPGCQAATNFQNAMSLWIELVMVKPDKIKTSSKG